MFEVQAAPNNPDEFPFVCVGNKVDLADTQRAVPVTLFSSLFNTRKKLKNLRKQKFQIFRKTSWNCVQDTFTRSANQTEV